MRLYISHVLKPTCCIAPFPESTSKISGNDLDSSELSDVNNYHTILNRIHATL